MLPVSCKKNKDVEDPPPGIEFDLVSATATPQQMNSGAKSWIDIVIGNPSRTVYNLLVTTTQGYITGNDGTINTHANVIYNGVKNLSNDPMLILLKVRITNNTFGLVRVDKSITIQLFILPESESIKSNPIDFSKPFKYIDSRTGKVETYTPGGQDD
jgi:hypothetical protein